MDLLKDQLDEMLYTMKKQREIVSNELAQAPDGRLICCKNHAKYSYMKVLETDQRRRRIAINKYPDEIKALARKVYLEKVLTYQDRNIDILTKAIKGIVDVSPEALISAISRPYQNLPPEFFFENLKDDISGDELGEKMKRYKTLLEWSAQPYEKSTFHPEHLIHRTSMGFKVRSKSELIIVEQLYTNMAPTRYEQILYIGNRSLSTDFSFLDICGEEFYWEHAGMMDIPEYRKRHEWKMELYESAGIVPWKNLIVTYDNNGDLNLPMIKSIIENEVLPRLYGR